MNQITKTTENFKRPKNREDGSDFDDFWTKSIASTRSVFWKIFASSKTNARQRKDRGERTTNDKRTTGVDASTRRRVGTNERTKKHTTIFSVYPLSHEKATSCGDCTTCFSVTLEWFDLPEKVGWRQGGLIAAPLSGPLRGVKGGRGSQAREASRP